MSTHADFLGAWLPEWLEVEAIFRPHMKRVETEDLDPRLADLSPADGIAWLEGLARESLRDTFDAPASVTEDLMDRLPSSVEQRRDILARLVSFLIVAAANDLVDLFRPPEA